LFDFSTFFIGNLTKQAVKVDNSPSDVARLESKRINASGACANKGDDNF